VSRIDAHAFRFSVPLGAVLEELMQGAAPPGNLGRLVPAITVRTARDDAARCVTLSGSEATLGVPEEDELFSLLFTTTMAWSGGPPDGWVPPPPAAAAAAAGAAVLAGGASGSEAAGAGASAAPPAPPLPLWGLICSVDVRGELSVPPPLAKLPRALLGGAGSLVAKAVAQAVLPRFAELLAADYARWASGERRDTAAGSLMAARGALAAAAASASASASGAETAAQEVIEVELVAASAAASVSEAEGVAAV
jgi:hypothetical protein